MKQHKFGLQVQSRCGIGHPDEVLRILMAEGFYVGIGPVIVAEKGWLGEGLRPAAALGYEANLELI